MSFWFFWMLIVGFSVMASPSIPLQRERKAGLNIFYSTALIKYFIVLKSFNPQALRDGGLPYLIFSVATENSINSTVTIQNLVTIFDS
jgi:hypothetical protein